MSPAGEQAFGPLQGLRVVEVAGIGPGPFAGMMLADMGAEVIRVERPGPRGAFAEMPEADVLARGRRSVVLDLKDAQGLALLLELIDSAEVVFEGFRPGVAERLGFGPDVCLERNPRLVYGRMTGYGQDGPLAQAAGHDINYLSVAGALYPMGRRGERPVPPLNLVGDFGGGGMLLAYGIVCAVLEARRSGRGQVVDAAMIDGASALMGMVWGARAQGMWSDERGTNVLDGAAHFYDVYETSDGGYVSVGAMEPQFYRRFLEHVGLADHPDFADQRNKDTWARATEVLVEVIGARTRDEWAKVFAEVDACVTPVLSMAEVADHPHHRARDTFVEIDGVLQGNAAPRLSRTPGRPGRVSRTAGEDTEAVLAGLGHPAERIAEWRARGVFG
jgi:alpha-methylacyl-CoA racemase